jgi:hypothetical protein
MMDDKKSGKKDSRHENHSKQEWMREKKMRPRCKKIVCE